MELDAIWLMLLAISSPIAGFLGFAIQLRTTKKLRLENEKLQLEVLELKVRRQKSEQVIVEPTNEEVQRFTSRASFLRVDSDSGVDKRVDTDYWRIACICILLGLMILAGCFIIYL
ncbi:MAG: hypothetical protein OIF55_13680 [Amphritea sp.]|nr:hypothetical protein [Amphritea sp.]